MYKIGLSKAAIFLDGSYGDDIGRGKNKTAKHRHKHKLRVRLRRLVDNLD
jgi:hypothetical protein